MICNFVISDVKLGIFLFIFLILIRSRFRAFRLGLEGGWLDEARRACRAQLRRVQAL